MVKCSMKKRRGVAGLISLIGLIVVFSFSSVAYLEMSSSQTELIDTSIQTNQKVTERNHQFLNFGIVDAVDPDRYDVTVENIGSETVVFDSVLIVNNKQVEVKKNLDVSVKAGSEEPFSILYTTNPANDVITFVTSVGKKCVIQGEVTNRLC